MKFTIKCLSTAVLTVASFSALLAQQSAAPPTDDVIRTGATEVVFDVVVRDKKGKAITNLKAENFEVIDNGAKQTITGFRLVEGREALEIAGANPQKKKLDPLKQIRLVTLAFSALGPAEQRIARESALKLVNGDQSDNTFYAVVGIYQKLSMLQTFTNDKKALSEVIVKATNGQYQQFLSDGARIREQLARRLGGGMGAQPANPTDSQSGGAMGSAAVEGRVNQIMMDMLRYDESLPEAENARTTLYGLRSLVDGLSNMPGRKVVMFFTWGMWFPPQMDAKFREIKSAANRGNVTFYGVDTRGVQTWGQNESSKQQLASATADTAADTTRDGGGASKSQILASDRAETASRGNVQLPLRELSEETGGFLIGETNDPSKLLLQVNEEINTYYEVAYDPGIKTFDGNFRKTSVNMKGNEAKGLVAHSRAGYFALSPEVRATGIDVSDTVLLKALSDATPPSAVEFRAGALTMTPGAAKSKGILLTEIPFGGLQFTDQPAVGPAGKAAARVRISMLTLIKDSTGQVVEKFSRDQPFEIPAERVSVTKGATFVQREQFSLAPGEYTVETAVMDREATKAGVKKAKLTVPGGADAAVKISSLAMIKNIEPNAKNLENETFQFQGTKVTPSLSNTVYATKGATLGLFFVVHPGVGLTAKPELMVEILRDGQTMAQAPLPLPAPDASGRIPFVFSVPAEGIPPGSYDVRASVKQGSTQAQQTTKVTIAAPPTR